MGAIVGATLIAAASAGALSFTQGIGPGGTTFAVGTDPQAIAIADATDDGLEDVITVNEGSDNLIVSLGDGAGGTQTNHAVALGDANPADLATGDFDDDGEIDVAVAAPGLDSVLVLTQAGEFDNLAVTGSVVLASASNPQAVAVGDMNRDGREDIVTANRGTGNASVLLGDGTGGFEVEGSFNLGSEPGDIVLGDWNGDGILDAAAPILLTDSVALALGDGTGKLLAPTSAASADPAALATGDFNGDGKRDLVVARRNGGNGSVEILGGDGVGGFTSSDTSATPSLPTGVAVTDVDGDGDEDVATSNDGEQAAALLGNGAGAVGAAAPFAAGTDPTGVAVGDLNLDGDADIATSNLSDNVTTLTGNGSGTLFGSPADPYDAGNVFLNVGGGGDLVQVGSLNDNTDSVRDVAVAGEQVGDSYVATFLGTGSGVLGAPTEQLMDEGQGQSQGSLELADFNEDDNLDLVTANSSEDNFTVRLGNGTGGFAAAAPFAMGDGPFAIAVADFDNDDDLDVATVDINGKTVSVRLGNGNGTFAAVQSFAAPTNGQRLAARDFDADGDDDLAMLDGFDQNAGTSLVRIYTSDGDGTFTTGTTAPLVENDGIGGEIEAANLDAGGDPDLVVVQGGTLLSVLKGSTGGTFAAPVNLQTTTAVASVALPDVDGDGDLDATTSDSDRTVSVYLNNGSGAFGNVTTVPTGGFAPRDAAVGDMNGDGLADLVASNVGSDDVSVLLQRVAETDEPDTRIEVHPDATTEDRRPSFSFASSEWLSTFECSIDKGTPDFGPCSGPEAMHTEGPLAPGNYTFRVRATDLVGNFDASPATFAFTVVDETPPNTKLRKAKINGKRGAASFRFSSNEPGSTFRCKLDGKAFRKCKSPKAYGRLKSGKHIFRVAARDAAGNVDPSPARKRFRIP